MTIDVLERPVDEVKPEIQAFQSGEREIRKSPSVRLKEMTTNIKEKIGEVRDALAELRHKNLQINLEDEIEEATGLGNQIKSLGRMSERALVNDVFTDKLDDDTGDLKTADQENFLESIDTELQPIEGVVHLMTTNGVSTEGIMQLGERLRGSDGKALVVVHPYFQDGNVSIRTQDQYDQYIQNLTNEVKNSQEQGIPLVLFECAYNNDELPQILNRIGVTDQETYLVPTEGTDPSPENGVPLVDLASLLHASGLQEATVIGTLFWEEDLGEEDRGELDRFRGCAGKTIERLSDAGVQAKAGEAVLEGL